MNRLLLGVSATFTACSCTIAGTVPTSWAISTSVETQAAASIVNDMDSAGAFFGLTESMVVNEAYEFVGDPPEKLFLSVGRGEASIDVQAILDGWSVDMSTFARSGSEDDSAMADAFGTFDVTFNVAGGMTLDVVGRYFDTFTKDSGENSNHARARMQVFRDGSLIFDTSTNGWDSFGWDGSPSMPETIFATLEGVGAEYRILTTTDVGTESQAGPGFWFGEGTADLRFDVLVVPAPASTLAVIGVALVGRRRR